MVDKIEDLRFVVDENLIAVGRALALLRPDLGAVNQPPLDHLLPSGTLDPDWIPIVASRRWTVITNDKGLRTRHSEAQLALDKGLRVVHLFRAGNLNRWQQATRLLAHWPAVEKLLTLHPSGPLWLSVRARRAGHDVRTWPCRTRLSWTVCESMLVASRAPVSRWRADIGRNAGR